MTGAWYVDHSVRGGGWLEWASNRQEIVMKRGRQLVMVLAVVAVVGSLGWGRVVEAQERAAVTWIKVMWEGVVLSLPQEYRFEVIGRPPAGMRAEAQFGYEPQECRVVGACPRASGVLMVYPSGGLNVHTWVERNGAMVAPSFGRLYGEGVVGDREAVLYSELPDMFVDTIVAVPVGQEILVIKGDFDLEVIDRLQFVVPRGGALKAGALAWTKTAWNLRTSATGGSRVTERPVLVAGSVVTILKVQAQAVQVRTSEGVTGWIQASAARALTTTAPTTGWLRPWTTTARVQVANGVPVREEPRSGAAVRTYGSVARLGATFSVGMVRGDWMMVHGSGSTGWVRWRYDGQMYVAR